MHRDQPGPGLRLQVGVTVNVAVFAGDDEYAFLTDLAERNQLAGEIRMLLEIGLQGVGLSQAHVHRTFGIIQAGEVFDRTGTGQHLRRLILFGQHAFQALANGVVATAALAGADHDWPISGDWTGTQGSGKEKQTGQGRLGKHGKDSWG